jgi:hypothetical protein
MIRQIVAATAAAEPTIPFVDTNAGSTTGGPADLGIPIAIFGAESIEEENRDGRGQRRPQGAALDLGAFEASKEP